MTKSETHYDIVRQIDSALMLSNLPIRVSAYRYCRRHNNTTVLLRHLNLRWRDGQHCLYFSHVEASQTNDLALLVRLKLAHATQHFRVLYEA